MSRREPTPIAPRRLTAAQAAKYLGYETTGVLASNPVKPRALAVSGPGSAPKYDRAELDVVLDRLAGLSVPAGRAGEGESDDAEAAYERWQAARAAR